ncbi:aldo/keto reductase [Tessaracoccus terricola]
MQPVATTPITLGASHLGKRDDGEALADAMVASPLGNVDTSNNYAAGRSEQLIGDAIRRLGGLPEGKLVYSKADRTEAGVFDGERVRRSLEESLDRLGLHRLPIYFFHDPFSVTFDEAMAPDGGVPALVRLREEGVIGAIGIATGPIAQTDQYVATGLFDAVLCHNRFTLVDRIAEPTFRRARELGMTVFNAAPFGGGTLANGQSSYGYREMPADFAAHVERVRSLADGMGVDLAAAAVQFSTRSPLVDTTVVGVSTLQRLEQLAGLVATDVPEEFFDEVERLGPPPASAND